MTQNQTQFSKDEIIALYEKYVVPSYTKNGIVVCKGKGSKIWDIEGNEYLDLYPGWGTSPLGHSPDELADVVGEQLKELIHVPNNYYHPWQGLLAQKIVERSFPAKCFFANSGAEANEGALKLARLFGSKTGKTEIITFEKSFHGRTYGVLTATGQEKYRKGFEPVLPGFKYAKYNDLKSVEEKLTDKTTAILLEPIQGEGGVYPATSDFLKGLRALCDEKNILLIFDEVQTGVGRTGEWFAYQAYQVVPDIMSLAKGLGGGIPIGVFLARPDLADLMQPGTHASTFGGAPIACQAALTVIKTIEKEHLISKVKSQSKIVFERFNEVKSKNDKIKEVRGLGFLIGVEIEADVVQIIQNCTDKGVLVNRAGENVVRLLPALNISDQELEQGLKVVEEELLNA